MQSKRLKTRVKSVWSDFARDLARIGTYKNTEQKGRCADKSMIDNCQHNRTTAWEGPTLIASESETVLVT
jgi:hypothetical protein